MECGVDNMLHSIVVKIRIISLFFLVCVCFILKGEALSLAKYKQKTMDKTDINTVELNTIQTKFTKGTQHQILNVLTKHQK